MKLKFKDILRIVALVFLGIVLGFNVCSLSLKTTSGDEMPMPFGFGSSVVQSGSMEPTFSVGDLLFVKQKATYEAGDIVVFQTQGGLVVHRIVDIEGDSVTTQGDANNAVDEPIFMSDIKGSVVQIVPKAGFFIDFLKTPFGCLLVGCVVICLFAASMRENKRERDEEATLRKQELTEEIDNLKRELGKNCSSNDLRQISERRVFA